LFKKETPLPNWGKDYTVKKFYNLVYDLHPIFKAVWKSRCTPRVKFFISLIFVDRLNTIIMLSRRHIGDVMPGWSGR
jgi:hypothetical protein